MKLAPVTVVSDATGFGGAELYLTTIAGAASATRDVTALVSVDADPETRRGFADAGVRLREIRGFHRVAGPAAALAVARELRASQAGLVHLNLTDQGDGLAMLAGARLARIPTLATLHLVIPGRAGWRERIARRALRLPTHTIGVSHSVGSYLSGLGARTSVIHNGVPVPVPAASPRKALGLPDDAIVVGGLGRLDVQKGWDVLCRAATAVRAEVPDARFVVLGDGPLRAELEALGAETGVEFAGYVDDATSLLTAFDVIVVPSRYEAFGLVAAEAMLAGVPVVATDVDGLPEVLGDSGFLIPPDDDSALASAVIELVRDGGLRARLVESAAARATTLFPVARMCEETLRLYDSIARSGRARETRR